MLKLQIARRVVPEGASFLAYRRPRLDTPGLVVIVVISSEIAQLLSCGGFLLGFLLFLVFLRFYIPSFIGAIRREWNNAAPPPPRNRSG